VFRVVFKEKYSDLHHAGAPSGAQQLVLTNPDGERFSLMRDSRRNNPS